MALKRSSLSRATKALECSIWQRSKGQQSLCWNPDSLLWPFDELWLLVFLQLLSSLVLFYFSIPTFLFASCLECLTRASWDQSWLCCCIPRLEFLQNKNSTIKSGNRSNVKKDLCTPRFLCFKPGFLPALQVEKADCIPENQMLVQLLASSSSSSQGKLKSSCPFFWGTV